VCAVALAIPGSAGAQDYSITASVVAGGGSGPSVGGTFGVTGTIGQAAAGGPATGGQFSVDSGFWPAAAGTAGANVVENGDFTAGATGWLTYGGPDSGMTWQVTNGVFEFQRSGSQAVVFQNTGQALAAGAPLLATFQLGNTDTVRKRVSVLLHDADFLDLHVCTFWLPPNLPLTAYGMRTHTTKAWANLTISIYAATVGTGGFYRVDNVSVQYSPTVAPDRTDCLDPLTAVAPGGPDSATMLTNGSFTSGLAPWTTFGQIQWQVQGGVFEFIKLAGTPAGLVKQSTGQAVIAGERVTATFELGNSSGVRKRVTAILHDDSFADLSACTFWLAPGQPLSPYVYRAYATQNWTNATLSIYPATVGAEQWIRFDNATMKRTPSATISGTECLEPGASPGAGAWTPDAVTAQVPAPVPSSVGGTPPPRETPAAGDVDTGRAVDVGDEDWVADGFVRDADRAIGRASWIATSAEGGRPTLTRAIGADVGGSARATLRFESWLSAAVGRASIQVSDDDGVTWTPVAAIDASDTWESFVIDLGYVRPGTHVRFVWDGIDDEDATWRLRW
jgi:hypothetical protein